MSRYLLRLILKYNIINPTSLSDKIDFLLTQDINVYKYNSKIVAATTSIMHSIVLLDRVKNIDYYMEYALLLTNSIMIPHETYSSVWYSNSGTTLDKDTFILWLELVYVANMKYISGIRSSPLSKEYVNSIKIKPLIQESDDIITHIVKSIKT